MSQTVEALIALAESLEQLSVDDPSFEARVKEYSESLETYLSSRDPSIADERLEGLAVPHAKVLEKIEGLKVRVQGDLAKLRRNKGRMVSYLINRSRS